MGKALMIQARVHGRKHSKRKLSPDLLATYSGVCLVKTDLRSNESTYSVLEEHIPFMRI